MARISIVRQPTDAELAADPDARPEIVGWFDPDAARAFEEGTHWDGHNQVSVNTHDQWSHERLYRTKRGRWVLHWWSQWQGSQPRYRFIDDEAAQKWLLLNEHPAVEEIFGPLEDERGPGRPEIGPAFSVRFPQELTARLDAVARRAGLTRAAMLRRMAEVALSADGARPATLRLGFGHPSQRYVYSPEWAQVFVGVVVETPDIADDGAPVPVTVIFPSRDGWIAQAADGRHASLSVREWVERESVEHPRDQYGFLASGWLSTEDMVRPYGLRPKWA